jgi:hypothetical protein
MTPAETMPGVEKVEAGGIPLAYVIRAELRPAQTTFPTPADVNLQVGFVVYPAGGAVARHTHRPLARAIVGTAEFLIVKQGRCLLDLYTDAHELVATRELATGDLVLLVAGGHGVRMLEATTLIEVKQGPYTGLEEKERF